MIMVRTIIAISGLLGAIAVGFGTAFAASPRLTCMEPTILDTNPNPAFDMLPGVYSEPSSNSKKIGVATSVVYAVTPMKQVNGFIEVLHPNGATGWVQESELELWHNVNTPSARCTAQVLPDGKPHAAYSS
jgi:hypothetical protein